MSVNEELVAVMVPRRLVTQVYGLIARLDQDQSPGVERVVKGAEGVSAHREEEWTNGRLRRLVNESSPAVRDILKLLASKPDKWLTVDDLANSISDKPDANAGTVAGTLGAFGRRIKSRYGLDVWPFEDRYSLSVQGREYRMSSIVSKRILEFLAG